MNDTSPQPLVIKKPSSCVQGSVVGAGYMARVPCVWSAVWSDPAKKGRRV